MKTGVLAVTALALSLLIIAAYSSGESLGTKTKDSSVTRLISLLPDSDGVAVFDTRRSLADPLPTLLLANEPLLAKVKVFISQMEINTGIDLRNFEHVVIGVAAREAAENFEPVAIASVDVNEGSLIALANLISRGNYREEEVGGRTIYIFQRNDARKAPSRKTRKSKVGQAITEIPSEIALTVLDGNTLAVGYPDRVRQTIESTSHVDEDIIGLLSTTGKAAMSFALRTSGDMSKFGLLGMSKSNLGAKMNSIQYLSGSMDIDTAGTSLQLIARTATPGQAQKLLDALLTRQLVGMNFPGRLARADQQVYNRMVENAELDLRGNDVTLDLLVLQADIDVLMAGIK